MRILFAGTPAIAVPSLQALIGAGAPVEVVGVLTNPDAPAGRGKRLSAPPVKTVAEAAGVPVLQPARLDADARTAVGALRAQLLVCVAYGKIFGPKFLSLFEHGGINMHPSLLPRHRGPTPMQGAILSGDAATGVTVQALALEMDAGDILYQESYPLNGGETAAELADQLAPLGAAMVVRVVRAIEEGTVTRTPQDHSAATYTALLRREDGYLRWTENAQQIDRMVRAFVPWPAVTVRWRGTPLQLLAGFPVDHSTVPTAQRPAGMVVAVDNKRGILVQTTEGVFAVQRLQLQSRSAMDWKSFLNGNPELLHSVLEQA